MSEIYNIVLNYASEWDTLEYVKHHLCLLYSRKQGFSEKHTNKLLSLIFHDCVFGRVRELLEKLGKPSDVRGKLWKLSLEVFKNV